MFLVNSKYKTRLPCQTTTISCLSDPTVVNPETLDEDYKLVAPRSHLYIVDRNTMGIVKKVPLNFKDLTPYDIYPDIAGKRYVGIVISQSGEAYVINALNQPSLTIYYFRQPYRINKNRFYVNDMSFQPDNANRMITFERIKFNKIMAEISVCWNTIERETITESAQDFERRDPKLYAIIGVKIQRFGEMRFMGVNRYLYTTGVLSGQRYEIKTNYTGTEQPGLVHVLEDLAQTLNTISEIEKLSIIMRGHIPQGYADLSHTLYSMSLPALATLSLVTRIHYNHKIEDIPARLSDEMLEKLRSEKVLGQYLSKTLVRKAYRLVRRLRINYLEGLTK